MLLQETHSSPQSSPLWEQEWGGDILFNHGFQSSRGVAILIDRQTSFKILHRIEDDEGSFLGVDIQMDNDTFTICTVYAPTQDKYKEQVGFLATVEDLLQELNCFNLLVGETSTVSLTPRWTKTPLILHQPIPTRLESVSFHSCIILIFQILGESAILTADLLPLDEAPMPPGLIFSCCPIISQKRRLTSLQQDSPTPTMISFPSSWEPKSSPLVRDYGGSIRIF